MCRVIACGVWGVWHWGTEGELGEDLSEVLDWYLTPQGAKVQTENLSLAISSVGNRRRNRRGWFPFSRAGGNHSCEMCCIIRHLYNCYWNRLPKPSRHILQSRELMSSTATLEHCTYSCWGCSRENQEQVLRENKGLTEDLRYIFRKKKKKKNNQSSAATTTIDFCHQNCCGRLHFIALLSTAVGQEQLLHSDTLNVCILTPAHGYGFRQVFVQSWGCSPAAGPGCQPGCKSLLIWDNCKGDWGTSSWELPSGMLASVCRVCSGREDALTWLRACHSTAGK